MTAERGSEDRFVIPRWRFWRTTERSGELLSLKTRDWHEDDDEYFAELKRRERAYERDPGTYTAADLLATAVVLDVRSPTVDEAALEVLADPQASPALSDLASTMTERGSLRYPIQQEVSSSDLDTDNLGKRIHSLRQIVRREPRNAVRWADLARAHAVTGDSAAATKAMHIALALGPPNRFLLRAAARLSIHLDEFDRAQAILVIDDRQLYDPWLLAAEVATSSLMGKTSRHMKAARKLLRDDDFGLIHRSELATAVATVEMGAGNDKTARRLIRLALQSPTDNSLAQAEWCSEQGLGVFNFEPLAVPLDYETQARRAANRQDWSAAVSQGLLWLADQPFAEDAADFTSYVAATNAEDYESAAWATEVGLRTNPKSSTLWNNRAFALANLGRIAEAKQAITSAVAHRDDVRGEAIISATQGLIDFRTLNVEGGRANYGQAVNVFRRLGDRGLEARALALWVKEEAQFGSDRLESLVVQLVRVLQETSDQDALILANRLTDLLPDAEAKGLRRTDRM
jgi:tetratricopeptide (TPR) repeat protein